MICLRHGSTFFASTQHFRYGFGRLRERAQDRAVKSPHELLARSRQTHFHHYNSAF